MGKEISKRGAGMRNRVREYAKEGPKSKAGGTKFQNLPEGTTFWNPKKGTNLFDIIPYVVSVDNHFKVEKGDIWYQKTYQLHYNIGPESKAYICRKTTGQRCPICEYLANQTRLGTLTDKEIDALRPRYRDLYNIIDLNDRDKGIQLFDMSTYLFSKQLNEEINEGDETYDGFALFDEGWSIKARFVEETLNKTTFLTVSKIDFVERDEQYPESICDTAIDLDKVLRILDYDELEKIHLGIDDDVEGPDDVKHERTKNPVTPKSEQKKAAAKKEEDEEEGEKEAPPKDDEREKKRAEIAAKKAAKAEAEKKAAEEEAKRKAEEEKAAKAKEAAPAKKASTGGPVCPHGGVFAQTVDELAECDACDLWGDCIDASHAA